MPIPAPGYPRDWGQQVLNYLKTFLPKDNLETFKRDLERMNKESLNKHYEIREIKPPRNGIVYSCTYDRHTMVSKPPMKSSYAHITQYWDVNGNCIGFEFDGKETMFPVLYKNSHFKSAQKKVESNFKLKQPRVTVKDR